MTLIEFSERYNYHDSSIVSMVHDTQAHTVILLLELSWWQQNDYKDGDPELVEKTFRFDGITEFDYPEDIPFDQIGIFSVNADDHSVTIYAVNDFTDEDFLIKISAGNVCELGQ